MRSKALDEPCPATTVKKLIEVVRGRGSGRSMYEASGGVWLRTKVPKCPRPGPNNTMKPLLLAIVLSVVDGAPLSRLVPVRPVCLNRPCHFRACTMLPHILSLLRLRLVPTRSCSHHICTGFAVQPLALRRPAPVKPPLRMMPFPVNRPPSKDWPSGFTAPVYQDDPQEAEEAVKSLVDALAKASCGTYKMTYTKDEANRNAIEQAIEAAEAAGADPEKVRVAREVVASQALPPIRLGIRFW